MRFVKSTIFDLGYFLSQVCIRFDNPQELKSNLNISWIESFLEGYFSIRILLENERIFLVKAMEFSALSYVLEYWVPVIDMQNWERYKYIKENEEYLTKLFENIFTLHLE